MTLRGLDHIGIAVRSIDRAVKFLRMVVGLKPTPPVTAADFGVKLVKLNVGGTKVELLEPLSAKSTVAKFIARRGEGIHHIAVAVPDVESALRELQRSGVEVIDKRPRTGASGRKIAFVSPKSCFGVLVELCEAKKQEGGRLKKRQKIN